MFGFGKAFRGRSYYVFNYTPRYYDERKERRKKLEEKYSQTENSPSDSDDEDVTITFTKNNLRKAWTKTKSPSDGKSTRRLALIITILVGIVFYVLDLHTLF